MTRERRGRDPLRFDPLSLLAHYGRSEKLSILEPQAREGFLGRIRESVEKAMSNPAFLQGQRTQEMFAGLVASLGKFALIKQEDAGDIVSMDDTLRPPDFRIVLQDGSQILVEVKNYRATPRNVLKPLKFKGEYIDSLLRYSEMMNVDLKLAVYWSTSNLWTLFPPRVLKNEGSYRTITVLDAKCFDELYLLGDLAIGAHSPLALRIIADKNQPREINDSNQVQFTIGKLEFRCAGRELEHPREKGIAFFLMLYGSWQDYDSNIRSVGKEVEWIEYSCDLTLDDENSRPLVGSLSSMFASYFSQETVGEAGVIGLKLDLRPGWLGDIVPRSPDPEWEVEAIGLPWPPSHQLHRLPLYILQMRPMEETDHEAETGK